MYESVYCSSTFYRNFNKPLGMTEKPMKNLEIPLNPGFVRSGIK